MMYPTNDLVKGFFQRLVLLEFDRG